MSRVPPPRTPQLPQVQHTGRTSAKIQERLEEVKAENEKQEAEKAADDKAESKHDAKHHAHHAHHAAKPKVPTRNTAGHHGHDPHDAAHAQHMAEALGWAPDSGAEAAEKKAEKDDAHAEEEREKQTGGTQRAQVTAKATVPAGKAETAAHEHKKDAFQKVGGQPGQQPGKGTGTGGSGEITKMSFAQTEAVTAASAVSTTEAVRQAAERALKSGKPPDAFQLLNQSQPPGVFFKEDGSGPDGAREDPELAAAVEEMIKTLFGVRGIMRVGPGRNQENEPVIVVAVGTGFGEASLRAVPEKISKYTTLIALPFEVLPLKKER